MSQALSKLNNRLNLPFFDGKLKYMIRFIKKWWLLKHLTKEINRHSRFQSVDDLSLGKKVLLSPYFFISNDPNKKNPEFPGLAYKSLHRFSWILWWRKKDNPEKLKKRIQEYNDIFGICVKEGYIEMIETEKNGIKQFMPSTATPQASKISGIFGLLEGILSEYNSVWVMILLPIITFILGITFKQIWNFFIL